MSRYDAEHEREWAEAAIRDARNFTVGATVYRHHFGIIEQGTVAKVTRCDDPNYGEKPNGKNPYYAATFVRSPGCQPDWEAQTYSWKFVATREEAAAQLLRYLQHDAEDKQREIHKLNERIAAIQSGHIEVRLEGRPIDCAAHAPVLA